MAAMGFPLKSHKKNLSSESFQRTPRLFFIHFAPDTKFYPNWILFLVPLSESDLFGLFLQGFLGLKPRKKSSEIFFWSYRKNLLCTHSDDWDQLTRNGTRFFHLFHPGGLTDSAWGHQKVVSWLSCKLVVKRHSIQETRIDCCRDPAQACWSFHQVLGKAQMPLVC